MWVPVEDGGAGVSHGLGMRGEEGLDARTVPLPVGPIQRSQDLRNICLFDFYGKGDRLHFNWCMMQFIEINVVWKQRNQ